MSDYYANTGMGGADESFQTTCWTQLQDARTSDEERERLIVDDLLHRYWKPVYCYLRKKGHSNDAAKDMTQGFFVEIVLGRRLFQEADARKGRFRSFLLTALKRYLIDLHRHESAEKRSHPGTRVAWADIDLSRVPTVLPGESPEDCFNHAWIAELLERVMLEVKRECYRNRMKEHWLIFEARVLLPIIAEKKPTPLPELCREYRIESESRASNMMITVKRRLCKALERNMLKLGENDPTLDEQVQDLLNILRK